MKATVDIAVAASGGVSPVWWGPVLGRMLRAQNEGISIGEVHVVQSALPDFSKNRAIDIPVVGSSEYDPHRPGKTDANRTEATSRFLAGSKSDWVFWMDDDTVPPPGVITQLLEARREFIAGIYFNGKKPHNPVAFMRDEAGFYHPIEYTPGSLRQVDSVGMGCTLIHRSVYEKIAEEHVVLELQGGLLHPIHKSQVKDDKVSDAGKDTYARGGYLRIPYTLPLEDDNRAFPFYGMTYSRTEDHWFCELARNVGIIPWIDMNVQCVHIKEQGVDVGYYKRWKNG